MKDVKILLSILVLCLVSITPAFAELDISNEKIQSADNKLILQFTDNTLQVLRTHTSIIPHIEYGIVDLGNVELELDDARVNVFGDSFTVKNDYLALYAKSLGDGKFSINTYINTNTGLQKNTFTASITPEQTTIPQSIITESVKKLYKPDLLLALSHDFRTYWKEEFNIDVQAYDGNINPSATGFEGRLDGVDVKVLLSLDGNEIAALSGVTTNHGQWIGEYFFDENISTPGEYTVDVILSYLGETVSKSSTMFLVGVVSDKPDSDNDFDNDGFLNNDDACPNDPEDFIGVLDGCPE